MESTVNLKTVKMHNVMSASALLREKLELDGWIDESSVSEVAELCPKPLSHNRLDLKKPHEGRR